MRKLSYAICPTVSCNRHKRQADESRNGIFCFERDVAQHIGERLTSTPGPVGIERAHLALAVHGGRIKVLSIVNFHMGGRLEAPVCSCTEKKALHFHAKQEGLVIEVEQHVSMGFLPDALISTQYYVVGSDAVCPRPTS